jgi:hypothetical protein
MVGMYLLRNREQEDYLQGKNQEVGSETELIGNSNNKWYRFLARIKMVRCREL